MNRKHQQAISSAFDLVVGRLTKLANQPEKLAFEAGDFVKTATHGPGTVLECHDNDVIVKLASGGVEGFNVDECLLADPREFVAPEAKQARIKEALSVEPEAGLAIIAEPTKDSNHNYQLVVGCERWARAHLSDEAVAQYVEQTYPELYVVAGELDENTNRYFITAQTANRSQQSRGHPPPPAPSGWGAGSDYTAAPKADEMIAQMKPADVEAAKNRFKPNEQASAQRAKEIRQRNNKAQPAARQTLGGPGLNVANRKMTAESIVKRDPAFELEAKYAQGSLVIAKVTWPVESAKDLNDETIAARVARFVEGDAVNCGLGHLGVVRVVKFEPKKGSAQVEFTASEARNMLPQKTAAIDPSNPFHPANGVGVPRDNTKEKNPFPDHPDQQGILPFEVYDNSEGYLRLVGWVPRPTFDERTGRASPTQMVHWMNPHGHKRVGPPYYEKGEELKVKRIKKGPVGAFLLLE